MEQVDLLLRNAYVFNSYLKKFIKKDIAVKKHKFYWIDDELKVNAKVEKDLTDKYVIPGLIDSHMHIESSMTTPNNFSNAVIKFGTTTIVADDHEIANVAGINGLKEYINSGENTLLDIFYAIPSSVPSTNEQMETTGGQIGIDEVTDLLKDPRIICLGEAMNFKGITGDSTSLIKQIIEKCLNIKPNFPIEGHCPQYSGEDLAKFIYAGVRSDHTQQTAQSIVEKISNGMFIQIQRKTLNKDIIKAIYENNLLEHVALVTDDVMPDDLLKGHLNSILKLAINSGMKPEDAIYISTYTPARHMNLRDRGAIAPGLIADFIILDDLSSFKINAVYKNGLVVNDNNNDNDSSYDYSDKLSSSVKAKKLVESDFILKTNLVKNGLVDANIIGLNMNSTFTNQIDLKLEVKDNFVNWQMQGLCLLLVQERYSESNNIQFGLVKGALAKKGAIGSTWAHDHHNLMILGNDINAMMRVQNRLIDEQGGYIVSDESSILEDVPLTVGGVVSLLPVSDLGKKVEHLRSCMNNLGYYNQNEIMSFSTLSLLVSQKIKISDKGLFDVKTQNKIPLFCFEHRKDFGNRIIK